MPSSPEDRLRVAAVISALKTAGVRVKNWKNFLNGETSYGDTYKKERRCIIFAFGQDLSLLPQCHLPEMGGAVPRFLVDACEYLSQHLHTEGLFRKTGSLNRIRALRVELERGQPVFCPPLSSSLQPCDVASLLKQFLRELPSPLIPLQLQGALCRAQGLVPEGGRDGSRDGVTLLVTALFPPSHARALRYLCTFLRSAAQRCSENRMEVGSLALLMAPNLLQGLAAGGKLTAGMERLLDRQAAVITALITHAERIGVVPSVIMDALSGAGSPSADGAGFQEKAGLSVYRSVRRQRRRSVGEMFVDALSKLKTGRTPAGPSQPSDAAQGLQVAAATLLQSPSTIKRKASEDTLPEVEGSAKKRRSIHDLREDNQPPNISSSDESESPLSQSPTPSLCSVTSGLEASDEHLLLGPQTPSTKKRNHRRNTKRVQRVPAPEDRAQRRRRSLRFFTASSWSSSITAPSVGLEGDNWWLATKQLTDSPEEPPSCKGNTPFQAPVILIDGPEGVVVGSEVEDDPETLNCSFVESPGEPPVRSRRVWSAAQLEEEGNGWLGEGPTPGAGATNELHEEAGPQPEGAEDGEGGMAPGEWRDPVADVFRRVSRGFRPPRRSISLPEVTSEQAAGGGEGGEEEEEGGDKFGGSDFHDCAWSAEDTAKDGTSTARGGTGLEQSEGGGRGEAEEEAWPIGRDKRKETEREKKGKKDEKKRAGKVEDSGLGFVRCQQRMSVADRMRRFNVLSAWLRAPSRPLAVPPAPQRGPVRLRRQGARRFSRSVSHEGMAGLLQEQSAAEPVPPSLPEQSTAEATPRSLETLELKDQDPSPKPVYPLSPSDLHTPLNQSDPHNPGNLVNSSKPHNPLSLSNPVNPRDPPNPQDPLSPHNPQNSLNLPKPLNFPSPLSPSDLHNPPNPPNPINHSNSHNLPNPVNHSNPHNLPTPANHSNPHHPMDVVNPRDPLSLPTPLAPLSPAKLAFRPPKPPRRHPSRRLPQNPGGPPRSHVRRSKALPLDPERPPRVPELWPEEKEELERENRPPEPNLHELLELQLRIEHLPPEPPASQNALCLTPPCPLQGPKKKARSPCLLSLPPPPPYHSDSRAQRSPAASPPARPLSPTDPCRPLEVGTDRSPGCGANAGTGTGGDDPFPSLSPPPVRVRATTTRRRYRDSPRWPIPEIRITTLTPYQL